MNHDKCIGYNALSDLKKTSKKTSTVQLLPDALAGVDWVQGKSRIKIDQKAVVNGILAVLPDLGWEVVGPMISQVPEEWRHDFAQFALQQLAKKPGDDDLPPGATSTTIIE